jgi:hypothetical protein
VEGTNTYQTAYQLEQHANMTMKIQDAFPRGVPFEFSFECTYKARQQQDDPWHLFHLTNSFEESQLCVTMDPQKQCLELTLPDINGDLQTVEFNHAGVKYSISCLI